MKRLLFISFLVVLSVSSYAKKSKKQTLALGDIHPIFLKYEDNKELNFVKDSIKYYRIAISNYDYLFKEAAVIYASVKQLSGSVSVIISGDFDIDFALDVAEFGETLPELIQRVVDLQVITVGLKPLKDFRSLKTIRKVPPATKGLSLATKQLLFASKELPKLTKKLMNVTRVIDKK